MAKTRYEHFNGRGKRVLDEVALTFYADALMLPAAGAMIGSMIDPNTRSWNPFYVQERNGRKLYRIRTLAHCAEQGLRTPDDTPAEDGEPVKLITYGSDDPRASKYGKFVRGSGLDSYLELLLGGFSFYGIHSILDVDAERYKAASPELWKKQTGKMEEYGIKPAIVDTSSIWRRGITDPMSPEACRRSMEFNIDYLDNWSLAREARAVALVFPHVVQKMVGPKVEYVETMTMGVMEPVEASSAQRDMSTETA